MLHQLYRLVRTGLGSQKVPLSSFSSKHRRTPSRPTRADVFEIEQAEKVREAVDEFANSGADFADCLIGKLNQDVVEQTLTFDQKLAKLSAFTLLS